MADVRFVRNGAGFAEIENGSAMRGVCGSAAARIASAAGPGHASDSRSGARRVHARAYTTTNAARAREFGGGGPLKRSIGAGRL